SRFFLNLPASHDTSTLSLHDALPILQGFQTFFESPRYVEAFWNTVKLGVIATIGTLTLGAPLAYVVARYDFPGKGIVALLPLATDRKSTRLNSSHVKISYAVFCLKKK